MSDNTQSGAPAADALNVGSQVVDSQEEQSMEQEGQEPQVQPAPETQQQQAEAKRLNKLKLKVYGQEVEEELPFEIEENPEAVEYLTKQLQLAKAAQKAMQENNSYKSQVEQFFKSFKSDTKAALKEMGIDPKQFAAEVIEEEIKRAQLTPEQRELEELKAEKKRLEEERKREKEEFEKKEYERLSQQEYERVETQMSMALEKSSLPKEPYVVKKIADYMLIGIQNGIDLSPEEVLPLVEQEIKSDLQALIKALGEDKVEDFVGKDVFNKIRKKNLAKAKQTPATAKAAIKDVGASPKIGSEDKSEKLSMKDFFKI